MKAKLSLIPVVLGIVLLNGCASRYTVRVDALSAPNTGSSTPQTYVLASDHPEVETADLFFKEVSTHINTLLRKNNLREAQAGEGPDLRVGVKAFLSEPMVETRSYSEPIYVESRGHFRTVRIPVVNSDGKFIRYAYREYWTPPRTHFAGYVDRDQQVTVYEKILVLSAKRLGANGQPGEEMWNVKVSLRSQSTDYRQALPYMLLAAKPYIGKRTKGEEEIVIKDDDPGLLQFLGGERDGR
ncbi:hypothetical protein G0Q06_06510 [Puniceicoccales bacterium CK1056]|uniref:Uncharacterized protein n=1 Tax=Oceanipulchritudo coccoides TaxID=2706888 RepID=A0A6B2M063_9BACT|nr:hypothetical protein [Oceanipulchritudo coccoides]NDV62093.1 hypothetical protein [Oceanipulchritudo coccoides]